VHFVVSSLQLRLEELDDIGEADVDGPGINIGLLFQF